MVFRRLISKHSDVGVGGLTRAERVLWVVFELCGEVSNGGLDQYFSNSSGDRGHLVPDALDELGQTSLATAFRPVLQPFAGVARFERGDVLRGLTEDARAELLEVDRRVGAQTDALLHALYGWIAENTRDFVFPNEGLSGFRPVDVAPNAALRDVLAGDAEAALPGLLVYWSTRGGPPPEGKGLAAALHAFGEVSEEGAFEWLFSRKGNDAVKAIATLREAGADDAASLLERAVSQLRYAEDVTARRAELLELDEASLRVLSALRWELDGLREPTLRALHAWAVRSLGA